jgi:hypothetical protein
MNEMVALVGLIALQSVALLIALLIVVSLSATVRLLASTHSATSPPPPFRAARALC